MSSPSARRPSWLPFLHRMRGFYIQVVPGQARGGSFKIETLAAYGAEQRLCLSVAARPSVLRSNKILTCQSDAMSLNVGSFLASFDLIAPSFGNGSLHPIATAVCVIPSHLISCLLSFFSPRLISSHLMTPLPFSSCLS